MITVALIGPDGVGKTTIAKRLQASFPLPIEYLYMGVNPDASNYMLPTTRWWERRKARKKTAIENDGTQARVEREAVLHVKPREPLGNRTGAPAMGLAFVRKGLRFCVKSLGLINRVSEEWYRQLVAFLYTRRGFIVIFDRHFVYDYFHYDMQPGDSTGSLTRKIHAFLLRHMFPAPDLVVCLDAPGSVVFERKGEFTPELLELKRNQYLSLRNVAKHFAVVDATGSLDTVVQEVTDLIYQFYEKRRDGLLNP